MLINLVWYEPAFMLELHTKSLPVTSGVVFTNQHVQLSAVVCGGTSFHAKTAHQDSVWLPLAAMHIPVNLGVVSTKQHAHQLSAAAASTAHPIFMRFPPSCYFKIGFYQ